MDQETHSQNGGSSDSPVPTLCPAKVQKYAELRAMLAHYEREDGVSCDEPEDE